MTCSVRHEPITYESEACPLCALESEAQRLSMTNQSLREEQALLQKQVDAANAKKPSKWFRDIQKEMHLSQQRKGFRSRPWH